MSFCLTRYGSLTKVTSLVLTVGLGKPCLSRADLNKRDLERDSGVVQLAQAACLVPADITLFASLPSDLKKAFTICSTLKDSKWSVKVQDEVIGTQHVKPGTKKARQLLAKKCREQTLIRTVLDACHFTSRVRRLAKRRGLSGKFFAHPARSVLPIPK